MSNQDDFSKTEKWITRTTIFVVVMFWLGVFLSFFGIGAGIAALIKYLFN
jgi:hypothetical protein